MIWIMYFTNDPSFRFLCIYFVLICSQKRYNLDLCFICIIWGKEFYIHLTLWRHSQLARAASSDRVERAEER